MHRGASVTKSTDSTSLKAASFKQYRDADGKFYFKLLDAQGKLLLQSIGHASARDAGQLITRLKAAAASDFRGSVAAGLQLGDAMLGALADDADLADVIEALATFAEPAVQAAGSRPAVKLD